LAWQQESS